ncbi:MAG: endonuclease/exonuclease/phosphatase family protein [Anaerolineales bacterium]|nr:endonuclease/exonuclease/phosphatase family protein [Anaerolineales bacterium]
MKEKTLKFILVFIDLAFLFFFVWYFLSTFTHGRFAWVSVVNMFAFQFFLVLLLPALFGFFLKIRRHQVAASIAFGLFLFMYGRFFIPKGGGISDSNDHLKVMTYNMLVYTPETGAVGNVIREEAADIVFMQETSFGMSEYLENEMKDLYPYQLHFPSDVPVGMSLISKHPFALIYSELGGAGGGTPILLDVNWNGQTVHVLNFHMPPTAFWAMMDMQRVKKLSESRTHHAQRIDRFLVEHSGPAIVAGDVNDVFLNDAYATLINSGLQDAWLEGGLGLGHTFPGNESPGTSRPQIAGIFFPEWMVRIDYIFVSSDWEVLSTYLAETDGYSDHRGVVSILRLK